MTPTADPPANLRSGLFRSVDGINAFGVSPGRFASSIPVLSQLKSIFEPGSIPGSSTTESAGQDVEVLASFFYQRRIPRGD
jgi:hypothetical protein